MEKIRFKGTAAEIAASAKTGDGGELVVASDTGDIAVTDGATPLGDLQRLARVDEVAEAQTAAADDASTKANAAEANAKNASVAKWKPATAYTADQVVQAPDGSIIYRLSSGTSRATFDGTEAALWAAVSSKAGTIEQASQSASYAPNAGNIDATVRKLADDNADVAILFLDDSTGAQTGQYPDVLMPQVQALYPHRTLYKRTWDNTTHTWGSEVQVGTSGTSTHKIVFWQGAVSGTVYEQPLNYWDAWVTAVQPDLAVIGHGHNYGKTAADGGQPSDAVMDQVYRERCLRFVAEFKRACPTSDVLLVSQNPYLTTGARTDISGIRAQTKREIAADLGCAYGPILEAYKALGSTSVQATYLNADGLHPLTSGSTNGASVAAAALLPLFKWKVNHEISSRLPSPFLVPATTLLTNGDFIEFTSPPTLTGWTASNVTLSKDTTNYESANGYSVKGTATASANAQAYQSLPIRKVRGRVITLAARFYVPAAVSSAQPGRVQLTGDGVTTLTSGTITSVRDNWVWVFVTAYIPAAATFATASLIFGTTSGEYASCDRASVVLGHLPRDPGPRGALTTYQTQITNTEDSLTVGQMVPRRDLMTTTNIVQHTTGTLGLSYFTAEKNMTASQVTLWTGTIAAAATPTLCRVGIYSIDGSGNATLIASTPNDTTLFAATNTKYVKALSSSVALTQGNRYAIGVLIVTSAAVPTFMGPAAVASLPQQEAFGLAPRMIGRLTTQTDLPSTFTEAVVSAYSLRAHCLVS